MSDDKTDATPVVIEPSPPVPPLGPPALDRIAKILEADDVREAIRLARQRGGVVVKIKGLKF